MPHILAAELSHETNVFSVTPTDLAAFSASGIARGDAILDRSNGTNSAFGGFTRGASAEGFALLPVLSVWATPSGMVTAEAICSLTTEITDAIIASRSAGRLDGVLLALHGAMVTEDDCDGDGALLGAIRAAAGPECPIVATLDLHANISQSMVDAATVLIGYDTYPHVDMADRAAEACKVMANLLAGRIHPVPALVKPPMLPTSQNMTTARDPMRRLLAAAHEAEARPDVINVTIAGGFPPADVEECGFSVLVTTDGNPSLANQIASDVARLAWSHREEFLGGVTSFPEALQRLLSPAIPGKPTVIVDIGDNPWTGGPGDSAELLRFLLHHGVTDAALALVKDPDAVAACVAVGVGNHVNLDLGGRTDRRHGEPLAVQAWVRSLSNGRYVNEGPMMAGVGVDLGRSAVIICGPDAPARGIDVIVTSRAETPISLNIFRRHGIDPTERRVLALKGKGHFRASFEPIAGEVILVEGPGITGSDLSRLDFRHVRRPIWPLDAEATWD